MPGITNNFVARIVKLVRDFFGASHYQYGTLDISMVDNDSTMFIETELNVLRVWFSIIPHVHPYNENMGEVCYISEAVVVPGGFQFKVQVHNDCRLSWFAIEDNE